MQQSNINESNKIEITNFSKTRVGSCFEGQGADEISIVKA